MVKLTARQQKLLTVLTENENGVSLKTIEFLLKVSRRTIYREFSDLKLYLQSKNIEIENVNGSYKLTGAVGSILPDISKQQTTDNISTGRRENVLASRLLLENQPEKIITFALDLDVSEGTIQRDLTKIEDSLQKYNLQITKQKGVGVYAVGSEKMRRQVLCGILMNELNEYYFLRYVQTDEEVRQVHSLFAGLLPRELLQEVYRGLQKVIFPVIEIASDRKMIQLILITAISIYRAQQGNHVKVKKNKDSLRYIAKVYELFAAFLADMRTNLTTDEALYIASQIELRDYTVQDFDLVEETELPVSLQVREFIRNVSDEFGWNFQRNPDFFKRLLRHILNLEKNSKERLPNGHIETLQNLTVKYKALYNAILNCWSKTFDIHLVIPEYQLLLLYFANEYTNRNYVRDVAALIVCENGIGTANILASRLKKELPEVKKIDISHLAQLAQLDIKKYDLILATLELPGFPREYQIVSPLLLDDEVARLKDYLNNYQRPDYDDVKSTFVKRKNASEKLDQLYKYTRLTAELVRNTKVHEIKKESDNITDSIVTVLDVLDDNLISDKEQVKNALVHRIELAPIGIPDTKLALLHTSNAAVKRCYFAVFELTQSIEMLGMDKEKMAVSRYTFMIAPKEITPFEQKALGIISSAIVMNSENTKIFEKGTTKQIQELLANQFLNEIFTN